MDTAVWQAGFYFAVLAAAVYTEGVARWRMVFTEVIDTTGDSIESLTAKANGVIEQQIRAVPEDWFWVHDRWKTPRPNFLLSKYKRGVYLPPPMSADQLKPFRILIRSSKWLGDAVMSVPAVRAIKRGRPDGHVTVLASSNTSPIWELIPEVDEVISANTSSIFSVVRAIRAHPAFDAAVLFPNSLRSALEVWLGRIPRRVGYRGHRRSWLLNQIVRESGKPRPPEHQAKKYLRIAQTLGADVNSLSVAEAVSLPNISPTKQNGQWKLGLCPGAEYGPAKRWLPERFAETATAVAAQHSVQWILFGKNSDAEVGAAIAASLGDDCVNRIGQTTLPQLIEELRQCRLLLTNDTGTMHLAALLGVPTISIFGSTEPRLTGPLGDNHIVVRHHVECSPCFLRECPIDFRCMKAVTTQEVASAILSMLGSGSLSRPRDRRD
jgi:heptosyltransferase-2